VRGWTVRSGRSVRSARRRLRFDASRAFRCSSSPSSARYRSGPEPGESSGRGTTPRFRLPPTVHRISDDMTALFQSSPHPAARRRWRTRQETPDRRTGRRRSVHAEVEGGADHHPGSRNVPAPRSWWRGNVDNSPYRFVRAYAWRGNPSSARSGRREPTAPARRSGGMFRLVDPRSGFRAGTATRGDGVCAGRSIAEGRLRRLCSTSGQPRRGRVRAHAAGVDVDAARQVDTNIVAFGFGSLCVGAAWRGQGGCW